MKILSVILSCSNHQSTMSRCLDVLLTGKKLTEIIIIDNASTDATGKIADAYAKVYPKTVKVIHQENLGLSGAIITGVRNASGIYTKVFSGCDIIDQESYLNFLKKLRKAVLRPGMPDLIITDYSYSKGDLQALQLVSYQELLPESGLLSWKDINHVALKPFFRVPSLIFRTRLLKDCALIMPPCNPFASRIYEFVPLAQAESIYYIHENFHHLLPRIELKEIRTDRFRYSVLVAQYLTVVYILIDSYCDENMPYRMGRRYLSDYMNHILINACRLSNSEKGSLRMGRFYHFLQYLKKRDWKSYYYWRYSMVLKRKTQW